MSANRIRSLDGLRALSILLVLAAHFTAPVLGNTPFLYWGELGVRIFFVISGFLITSLLEQERQTTGRISLRNFYARRSLRIFPLAYAFIVVVAILAAAGVVAVKKWDLTLSSLYLMSYRLNPSAVLGHLW